MPLHDPIPYDHIAELVVDANPPRAVSDPPQRLARICRQGCTSLCMEDLRALRAPTPHAVRRVGA